MIDLGVLILSRSNRGVILNSCERTKGRKYVLFGPTTALHASLAIIYEPS